MLLQALALLVALPPQAPPDPKPAFRRSLTLVNRSDDPLPAGAQVQVAVIMPARVVDGGDASDVQVSRGGARLATWSKGPDVWFRVAKEIPGRGRDGAYELRYGGGKAASRPEEVYEFFDGFGGALDPKKWDWSPDLGIRETSEGLEIIRIPAATNEFAPASLIPRVSLPPGFVFEADVRWAIGDTSPVSFALGADLAAEHPPDAAAREKGAALAKKLEAEDIETRDQAVRDLVKLGLGAVPALQEAARSKDPEIRLRAAQVLSRILENEAPPAIRTGLSPGDYGKLDRVDLLGRSRTVLRRSYGRMGGDTLSISRAEDGETSLAWTRRRPVVVHGKVERVRIDFWSPPSASDVSIRISRVRVRKHVELMPAAELGNEEVIR